MEDRIKSLLVTKKILYFINEIRRLDIIKYNKNLQNKINVNINDYKQLCNRYVIFLNENKTIGKEFSINNDNHLIFHGEYLNKKRNGKGKEYNINGDLIFEGDYLNGKRYNGKGIEFYKNGNIYCEKDYLNGKLNVKIYDYFSSKLICETKEGEGIIKEFNNFGKLIFEGKYLNGVRNEKGKEYDYYGSIKFEGMYLNGKKNGKGKEYYSLNKIKFEGEYLNDQRNGKGKEYSVNGVLIFEGEFSKGEKNGKGKDYYINVDKLMFEGEYNYGKKWTGKLYDIWNDNIYELKNGSGFIK